MSLYLVFLNSFNHTIVIFSIKFHITDEDTSLRPFGEKRESRLQETFHAAETRGPTMNFISFRVC